MSAERAGLPRRALLSGAAAAAGIALPGGGRAEGDSPVGTRRAWERAAGLGPGVNLSRWRQGKGEAPGDEGDLAGVAALGFRHIRLPVDPDRLLAGWNAPGGVEPRALERLVDDVRRMLERGLSVIVDLHPTDAVKGRVAGDAREAARLVALWTRMAAHLATLDPDRVLLEPLNEPGDAFAAAADWHALQGRLIGAIRAEAPRNTIVAAGAGFSTIGDLEAVTPYADGNVVYAFHFYAPMLFTHQGAAWSGAPFDRLREVPYPLPASTVRRLADAAPSDAERELIAREAAEGRDWDGDALAVEVSRAGDWSRRHGRPVVCTEFGAFRDGGATAPDRLRYLADARAALEAQASAWTLWDYSGGFGVVRPSARGRRADTEALAALGLREAPARPGPGTQRAR